MSVEDRDDRDDYASLADEFNDDDGDLADFDPAAVAGAERYARAYGLSWPPGIGDYDRLWERENR